jgi:DNA-binding NarL/FixJ family response regulator
VRLQSAARTTATLGVPLVVLYTLAKSLGQPVSGALLGVLVATVEAMTLSIPDPHARRLTMPLLPTARELEVLPLMADGLRNAEIAARLVISERTLDHHVSAILRKLDVRTRGEAGTKASRLGLISPETARQP